MARLHRLWIAAAALFALLLIAATFPMRLALSLAGYVVNWFGDSLDGSLARWRKIERPTYGYFVDHSVDAIATFLMVASMGMSPFLRFDVALLGVVGYFLLSIHTFLAAKVVGEFRLSYLAGGPTELRLMLMALTLAMPTLGDERVLGSHFSPLDLFGLGVASILVTLFVIQSLTLARTLARRES